MEIICPTCKALNRLHNRNCPACKTQLSINFSTNFWVEDRTMTLETLFLEVRQLREEKSNFALQLSQQQKKNDQQYRNLQTRLDQLEQLLQQKLQNQSESGLEEVKSEHHSDPLEPTKLPQEKLVEPPVQQEKPVVEKYTPPPITDPEEQRFLEEERKRMEASLHRKLELPKDEYSPPPLPKEKKEQWQWVPENNQQPENQPPKREPAPVRPPAKPAELPAWLVEFFAPISGAIKFVKSKYAEFKAQNKLPLFFLTLAGISALLFGVGFLVRYSANTWFGALSVPVKAGVGFTFTAAIVALGLFLIHKDKAYKGFGSALAGLGLSLNYLFIYFLEGSISPQWGFGLIFINSGIAIALALRYETKIIALLSLVAGGLSPLYLESTGEGSAAYFGYLWVLCAASVFIAKRIHWEVLVLVALVLSGSIAGLSVYIDPTRLSDALHLGLHHAFAYLFTYAALFDGLQLKKELKALQVVILLGAQLAIVSSLSYILGIYHPQYNWLSVAYFINSLPFIALLALAMKRMDNRTISIMLSLVSGFWIFGVAAVARVDYYGIFWSIESLIFIASGFALKLPYSRRLGYIILSAGFIMMLYSTLHIPQEWRTWLSPEGMINLTSIGFFMAGLYGILKKFEAENDTFENRLRLISSEAISVWLLLCVETFVWYHAPRWSGQTATAVAVLVIIRAQRFQLPFSSVFGFATFFTALAGISALAIDDLQRFWAVSLMNPGYFNLLSIGGWLAAAMAALLLLKRNPKMSAIMENCLAFWISAVFFVSTVYGMQEYAANLSILLLFGMLYWGNRRQLPTVEMLGAAHFLAFAVVWLLAAQTNHSFRFSIMPWYGKLAAIEMVGVLWSVKFFYDFVLAPSNRIAATAAAREASYVILSIIPIAATYSEAPDYIAYGAWGSVLVGFALSDFSKKLSLVICFYILVASASVLTFAQYEYWAMPIGAALLLGIFFFKKGYDPDQYKLSVYKYAFTYTFYYIGMAMLWSYHGLVSDKLTGIAALGGSYLLILSQFKARIFALESTAQAAYRLGWLGLLVGLVAQALPMPFPYTTTELLLFNAFFALGIAAIFAQVYYLRNFYTGNEQLQLLWRVDLSAAHLVLAFFYFDVFYVLTTEHANLLLTVAMVLHGVSLVLHTLRPNYKSLIWVYIPLLVGAIAKLFLWDMRNAPTIHRILAFIGVGVIFLVAAYFFLRYTKKQQENTNVPDSLD